MKRRSLQLLALAAAVFAAGCGDALSPPNGPSGARPDAVQPELHRGSSFHRRGETSFLLTPAGGTFRFGEFTLNVPAGVVCDPSSGYGDEYWDAPCHRMRGAVRVRVTLGEENGQQWIDFNPDLRFAPSNRPSRWVTLSTRRSPDLLSDALANGTIGAYALFYAPSVGDTPVDEGAIDASLVTHIQMGDGRIWRRIKHFSGFVISSGFVCTPAPEVACPTTEGTVDVIPQTTATP